MNPKKIKIAASILSADWLCIEKEITASIEAGADWIHLDVMDGHFVPSITFGPRMVSSINQLPIVRENGIILDVHLMIENPDRQIENFANSGANIITVHQEACPHLHRTIQLIHSFNIKAGVALNPATPLSNIRPILEDIDLLLFMTVNPGWGGQEIIPWTFSKIATASKIIGKNNYDISIEVDGGVNENTAMNIINAGAEILVTGSYLFEHEDYYTAINTLKGVSNRSLNADVEDGM